MKRKILKMNEKEKISKEKYLEHCKDALESVRAVLENNVMQKTTADLLKAIEITQNITKEVYLLSQENE